MSEKFASCSFNDFINIVELYRSQSGTVCKGVFKYDQKEYILKERKLPELGRSKDIMNEVKLLLQLNHTNVIKCEGWFRDDQRKSIFMILELCGGGDLQHLIKQQIEQRHKKYFEESYIWFIFHQLCQGLKHLHEHGIVHRDLKPLNVLCTNNARLFKIGDLGVSRQVSDETLLLKSFYGTPIYLSPELVENKPYNEKTDIWSLGVLLYELCALEPPFKATTIFQVAKLVTSGIFSPIPSHYSTHMQKCITWLLNLDFSKRPNIVQVIKFVESRFPDSTQKPNPNSKHNSISHNNNPSIKNKKVRKNLIDNHHEDDMDNDSLDGRSEHTSVTCVEADTDTTHGDSPPSPVSRRTVVNPSSSLSRQSNVKDIHSNPKYDCSNDIHSNPNFDRSKDIHSNPKYDRSKDIHSNPEYDCSNDSNATNAVRSSLQSSHEHVQNSRSNLPQQQHQQPHLLLPRMKRHSVRELRRKKINENINNNDNNINTSNKNTIAIRNKEVEIQKDNSDVMIDVQRLQMQLRRECHQYRKLLQLRNFVTVKPKYNHQNYTKEIDNGDVTSIINYQEVFPMEEHDEASRLATNIKFCQERIALLERGLEVGGSMNLQQIQRFDLLSLLALPTPIAESKIDVVSTLAGDTKRKYNSSSTVELKNFSDKIETKTNLNSFDAAALNIGHPLPKSKHSQQRLNHLCEPPIVNNVPSSQTTAAVGVMPLSTSTNLNYDIDIVDKSKKYNVDIVVDNSNVNNKEYRIFDNRQSLRPKTVARTERDWLDENAAKKDALILKWENQNHKNIIDNNNYIGLIADDNNKKSSININNNIDISSLGLMLPSMYKKKKPIEQDNIMRFKRPQTSEEIGILRFKKPQKIEDNEIMMLKRPQSALPTHNNNTDLVNDISDKFRQRQYRRVKSDITNPT